MSETETKRPTLKQYLKARQIDRHLGAKSNIADQQTNYSISETKLFRKKLLEVKKMIRNHVPNDYQYALIEQKLEDLHTLFIDTTAQTTASYFDQKSVLSKSRFSQKNSLKIPQSTFLRQTDKMGYIQHKENQQFHPHPIVGDKLIRKKARKYSQDRNPDHAKTWNSGFEQKQKPKVVRFTETFT